MFISSEKKLWRTLVGIRDLDGDNVWISVPAFDPKIQFAVPISTFPMQVMKGMRLFCQVNIGAEDYTSLMFKEPFEISPEPDPNDGLM